jgi:hypothetical protein
MKLKNFLNEEALELFLKTKGWKMLQPVIIEETAIFKPDFYEDNYTIAQGKHGRICAKGQTIINYRGNTFNSLLKKWNGLSIKIATGCIPLLHY